MARASTVDAGSGGRFTVAVEDEQWWRRIQPLAESLLEGDRAPEGDAVGADGIEVREFETGSVRCRACAVPMPGADRMPGTLVVAVERAGRSGPTAAQLREWFDLTQREAEVALLLARRRTNQEIARELTVTQYTARRHTEKVLQKLGLKRRTDVETLLYGE